MPHSLAPCPALLTASVGTQVRHHMASLTVHVKLDCSPLSSVQIPTLQDSPHPFPALPSFLMISTFFFFSPEDKVYNLEEFCLLRIHFKKAPLYPNPSQYKNQYKTKWF